MIADGKGHEKGSVLYVSNVFSKNGFTGGGLCSNDAAVLLGMEISGRW